MGEEKQQMESTLSPSLLVKEKAYALSVLLVDRVFPRRPEGVYLKQGACAERVETCGAGYRFREGGKT